jgi:hypothetical protein
MNSQSNTLVFCGKRNCCPQFEKVDDKIALVDDNGGMSYLTKEQLLDMATMFRNKTDTEILNDLGI